MQTIAAAIIVGSLIWFLIGLIMLLPRDIRQKARFHLKGSLFLALGTFLVFSVYEGLRQKTPEEIAAQKETIKTASQAAIEKAKAELEANRQNCTDKIAAFVMSQTFVKQALKSPSSASFPSSTEASVTLLPDCAFAVQSYVDAQNSFGATLRTSYYVELEYMAVSNLWRARKVEIAND